jgi:hypothetical protein
MTYLLILVIVMVALSPLLSMMPTRRQRQLATLRQAAASAGLYIKLERDEAQVEQVFYGCRRQRGDSPASPAALVPGEFGWVAELGNWPRERLDLLSELPPGVDRVREDREGVGLVWDEQGSREDVEIIGRVLRGLLGRHW